MRQSKPHFLSAMTACLLLMASSITGAEGPDTSLITDPEVPSEEWVTRELDEIKRRLGGSIVSDIPPFSIADHAEVTDFPEAMVQFNSGFSAAKKFSPQEETVKSLRDAAWQLDQAAEKLERSDLYKQADSLRDLAQQFRLDARAFRAQSGE